MYYLQYDESALTTGSVRLTHTFACFDEENRFCSYLSPLYFPFLDCQRQKLTANTKKNTPRIAPKMTPINVLVESPSSVISGSKYILLCIGHTEFNT